MKTYLKTISSCFLQLLLFITFGNRAEAQEIVQLGSSLGAPLEIPLKFHKAENVCRSEIPNSEKVARTVWEVFPLRNDLALYDTPNAANKVGTGAVGQHYVVYGQQGDYLLLGSGPTWGEQSENMAFKGWARKSDLLTHRMALKKNGIWRKAMVVNFIPSVENIELNVEDFQIAPFYANPELKGEQLGTIQVLRFLFVYETFPACSDDPQAVLVGEKPVMTDKSDLLGWIPIHRITLWDTREALELNFDPVAQANREAANLPAKVFQHLRSAYNYSGPKRKQNVALLKKSRISVEDFSEKYWPPEILRYPILRRIDMKNLKMDERDDIYEIGFIGNTLKLGENKKYKGKISRELAAGQQQALEMMFQNFSKLDVLFVVDATSSMGPYLKATADAIENAMHSISNAYSAEWDIRFAGSVYRDYEDERSNGLFEHRDLTPDQQLVIDFFRKVKDRSADRDYPEALFYGLKNAISATHFRRQSMRYVVLIADAGNHDPDKRGLDQERVAQSLYDYQCHFLTIRVAPDSPSGKESGPLLKLQTREWILENANRAQTDIQAKVSNVENQFSGYLTTPQLRDVGDLMIMVGSHVLGAYVVAENALETQSFIEKYLAQAVEIHDSFRDVTRLLATGASLREAVDVLQTSSKASDGRGELTTASLDTEIPTNDGRGEPAGMEYDQVWLSHILSRIPNAADLLERRVTIYERAFVNMFSAELKEPLFKPVVLMTASGLSSLINLVEDLVGNADTERLSETWRRVIDTVSGEEGVHKSVSDYARQRISLPVNSELLKMALPQIDELSNVKVRELVAEINRKKNELEKILYDDSPDKKRWFLMSEIKYYWIQVEELP